MKQHHIKWQKELQIWCQINFDHNLSTLNSGNTSALETIPSRYYMFHKIMILYIIVVLINQFVTSTTDTFRVPINQFRGQ